MTKILDLGANPVLGRLRATNQKHRFRSKHYQAVDDWPESGAAIDVLNPGDLEQLDHYPCEDQMFFASKKLVDVLRSIDGEIEAHEVDAAGRTVYLVMPLSDDDVMYEADGHPAYSKSGYSIVDGKSIKVSEEPGAAFCEVRNSGLLALHDDLVQAAESAEVRWGATDLIETYAPFRPHPYFVYDTGYAAASADTISAESEWPAVPEEVLHPLGSNARDVNGKSLVASFGRVSEPDESWTKLVHDTDDPDDCAFARYCSELQLPRLAAALDEDIAKSKIKKRWRDTLKAGCLSADGLPCVSAAIRDRMLEAGVEAVFDPVPLSDPKTGERREFFLIQPAHVVDWIDWSKSDVAVRWNGMMDEYLDLHPTEASYDATTPLVRVANSNIILVHESLARQLSDEEGFYMRPLSECFVSRNLDDGIKAT